MYNNQYVPNNKGHGGQLERNWKLFYLCLILLLCGKITNCTHVQGDFNVRDFFKFIVKFGFQKSESQTQNHETFGYVYGNITAANHDFPVPITLAVLDKRTFIDFYSNRSLSYGREMACQRMFAQLKLVAYDPDCNPTAKLDYFRRVPCPKGQLCIDEDTPSNVVNEHQFTYVISEARQPRFWYVTLVACYRNRTTCQWHALDPRKYGVTNNKQNLQDSSIGKNKYRLHYDIHVVNNHPNNSRTHPLTFEFSFDQQNLLEMYLFFTLIYMILLPMQIYAMKVQKHPVTKLFTLGLFSEFVSMLLITMHFVKFALNGVGFPSLQTAGDILDILSRTSFMLILLLLAKGWAVTRQQITRTSCIILLSIWLPYCAFNIFLYIWDRTEVDIIYDVDDYQTWPGWIILILRTTIMFWFLYELRNTMKYEHSTKKLDFLLHLGASSLVWFIYLPIIAIVALQVNPMWREKLLLGITNAADCLAYCVMTGLLWPNRAGQYLLLAGNKYDGMDELDEFNEAPHIVREREQRLNSVTEELTINGVAPAVATNLHIHDKSNGSLTRHIDVVDLLDDDEMDIDLLTDLNRNSHAVA